MFFFNAILIAFREIRRNLPRAFLTILGIIIGVAAVITMETLGRGSAEAVREQFQRLGDNVLILRPGMSFGPRSASAGIPSFTDADVAAIRSQISGVKNVAPLKNANLTTRFRQNARSTPVTGSSLEYFAINRWELADGRFFNIADLETGAAVCVIGETARRELFGNTGENAVGSKILVNNIACEVVGVFAARGQMGMRDQDDTVVMPITSLNRRIVGRTSVHDIDNIFISTNDGANGDVLTADINSLMRQRRNLSPSQDDNFMVMDTRQWVEAQRASKETLTKLLAAVAGISLLVGGIGIMNIMLVSVTERTREIGIRLAIGARAGEVLFQFLVEAASLSCFGGLIGILLAVILSVILAPVVGVAFVFYPQIYIIAFVFSALVGIVFGYAPARRAARLDPIEALRHE